MKCVCVCVCGSSIYSLYRTHKKNSYFCLCKHQCHAATGAAQTVPVSSGSSPVCQWHQLSEWPTKMRFMWGVWWWCGTQQRATQGPVCAFIVGTVCVRRVKVEPPELQTPTSNSRDTTVQTTAYQSRRTKMIYKLFYHFHADDSMGCLCYCGI